ncbi:MAG: hypothetical protein AAGD14_01190 [Planctomycetota bacterium]
MARGESKAYGIYLACLFVWALCTASLNAGLSLGKSPWLIATLGGGALTLHWVLVVGLSKSPSPLESPAGRKRRPILRWVLTWPIAAALVISSSRTNFPMSLRVMASEDALASVVEQSADGSVERAAGSFEVRGTAAYRGCTFLELGNSLEGTPAGIVHVPSGAEPPERHPVGMRLRVRHVTGNWWRFTTHS